MLSQILQHMRKVKMRTPICRITWSESNSWKTNFHSDDDQAIAQQLEDDLSQHQSRIEYTIERNTNKGAQNVLAGMASSRHAGKQRRRSSNDSGYVTIDQGVDGSQNRHGPLSRRSSDHGQGSSRRASGSISEYNPIAKSCETIPISSAEM
jgi:hypothetical protein